MRRLFRNRLGEERGQVLVLGIFVVVGLTMVAITVANVGAVIAEKIHLQDTADAAAYSAAVVEARYMNLSAYVNRAMIANYDSMAFNTAVWAIFDANDHGLAVAAAILYLVSIVATIIALGEVVDVVADGVKAVHDVLHDIHKDVIYPAFSQDETDVNKFIEMYNTDLLSVYHGVLYAAMQSARYQVEQEVATKMNKDAITTTVLGLGAEATSYDELAQTVDYVIRDPGARGGFIGSLNNSFNTMAGDSEDDKNDVYFTATTEASLDKFTSGRDRQGNIDKLRSFGTANIFGFAGDAMEFAIDLACEIGTLGFGSCNSTVALSIGPKLRDGFENKHDEEHVPVIARKRMREAEMFGVDLDLNINIFPGLSLPLGDVADFVGVGNHTSGEKRNDITNNANLDEISNFDFGRAFECILTGCQFNKINTLMAQLSSAGILSPPISNDDHWDGISDAKPVNWPEIYPPGDGQLAAVEYVAEVSGGFDLFDGVPKYDYNVDIDNVGFPNYHYDESKAAIRPDGISSSTNDNHIAGPSIGVVVVKNADKIPGLHGLGIGNEQPITAMARSQVYYLKNPKRPEEKPSLFNPHWVPRLAPMESQDTPPLLRKGIPFVASFGVTMAPTH